MRRLITSPTTIAIGIILVLVFLFITPSLPRWTQPFSEKACLELQLSHARLSMGTVTDSRATDSYRITCYVEIDNNLWYEALSRDSWEEVSSGLEK